MELRDAQFLICITCPSQATAIVSSVQGSAIRNAAKESPTPTMDPMNGTTSASTEMGAPFHFGHVGLLRLLQPVLKFVGRAYDHAIGVPENDVPGVDDAAALYGHIDFAVTVFEAAGDRRGGHREDRQAQFLDLGGIRHSAVHDDAGKAVGLCIHYRHLARAGDLIVSHTVDHEHRTGSSLAHRVVKKDVAD